LKKTKIVFGIRYQGNWWRSTHKEGIVQVELGWTGEGDDPKRKGQAPVEFMMHDGARLDDN